MEIKFYKLHLLKNDFILVDFRNIFTKLINDSFLSKIAINICNRHIGAGGSGIIFLLLSENNSSIIIRTFSSDGSLYENILDASIIASRYIFDRISVSGKKIKIINNSKETSIQILDSMNFRIFAGSPIFNENFTETIIVDNHSYNFINIILKENGVVFFPNNRSYGELKELSHKIKKTAAYSQSMPLFVYIPAPNSINIKKWIKAKYPDNSLTCCIASVAASLNGYGNELLTLYNSSAAYVEWDRKDNQVYISAKPEYIYTGNYYIDDDTM